MYKKHFSFKKEPFNITPDPDFLFLENATHKEALASIMYGVEKRKGFIMVTGDVGLGKTTILRSYLERSKEQKQKVIYIFNADISYKALLETIFRELDVDPGTDEVHEMVSRLHQLLIDEYNNGFNIVLIIDEAQNMPVRTLESIRMLSNLETSTAKLIQIVMIGQPELENMLKRNELRQLKQRIAVYSRLSPLTRKESIAYIEHRLNRSLSGKRKVFTRSALNLIAEKAGGIPRVLNILCDNALITGYGYLRNKVDPSVVREVIADFEGRPGSFLGRRIAVPAILTLVIALFLASPYKSRVFPDTVKRDIGEITRQAGQFLLPLTEWLRPYRGRIDVKALNEGLSPDGFIVVPSPLYSVKPADMSEKDLPAPALEDGITKVTRQGDFLSKMILETYGFSNDAIVDWISRENLIPDIDSISIGQKIRFPQLSKFINGEGRNDEQDI